MKLLEIGSLFGSLVFPRATVDCLVIPPLPSLREVLSLVTCSMADTTSTPTSPETKEDSNVNPNTPANNGPDPIDKMTEAMFLNIAAYLKGELTGMMITALLYNY